MAYGAQTSRFFEVHKKEIVVPKSEPTHYENLQSTTIGTTTRDIDTVQYNKMPKPGQNRKSKAKKSKRADFDDDASEPYSEELNVSSPEVLEMDDGGEVIMNSDWTKSERKNKKSANKQDKDIVDNEDGNDAEEISDDGEEDDESSVSDEEGWESEEESEEDPDAAAERKLATVSFDTLSKAQSLVPTENRKRKREEGNSEADEKLALLRLRLKELQSGRESKAAGKKQQAEAEASEDEVDASDSDEEGHNAKKGRSSKHAPTTMSSKRQVTRRRGAVEVPKANIRDPRFDPIADLDREKIRKNYLFLDDYVDSEIKDIKATLKTQRTPKSGSKKKKVKAAPKLSEEEVEALKRELVQKESKRQAQKARDRTSDVIKEHKQKERELVRSGKKAYFLKTSEIKEKVLVKQFEGMSEGKREKAMEKKRRRIASKERKNMPDTRRVVEE
jgi:ribosomal RNA-processing protein 36